MLVGAGLFVAGFATVFVTVGVVFGAVGSALLAYQTWITRAVGVLTIAMGLAFAGLLPLGRRELRLQRLPTIGLAGAPLLGVVFGLGWTPCLGPTLAVVISLALTEGNAARGGVLAFLYALGLDIPFVLAALAFTRMAGAIAVLRRHQLALTRAGGVMLTAVGVLLISGLWDRLTATLRQWAASFTTIL